MKKKISRKIIGKVLIILVIAYFTMTPKGALRLAVLTSGYPLTAFTLEVADAPTDMVIEANQIGYSLKNPPIEQATEGELVNWVVTRYGIFYFAKYFGWA